MQVRVNGKMLALLGGDPEFYEMSSLDVPEDLKSYFAQGFKEIEGCVIPRRFEMHPTWQTYLGRLQAGHDDETGIECGISHTHLEDLINREVEQIELTRLGCDYAWYVRQSLMASNILGLFQIIIATELLEPCDSTRPNCSIRVHRMRPDQSWLTDDLETYQAEAVMTMRFRLPDDK